MKWVEVANGIKSANASQQKVGGITDLLNGLNCYRFSRIDAIECFELI